MKNYCRQQGLWRNWRKCRKKRYALDLHAVTVMDYRHNSATFATIPPILRMIVLLASKGSSGVFACFATFATIPGMYYDRIGTE